MAESGLCREAGPERALQAWFFHTDQSVPAPSLGRKEQEKEGGQNVTLIQGLSILALLTFRAGQSFVVGAVLCIVGCSAARLAPYWRPEAPPPVVTAKNVSMCCQRSSGQQLPVSEALTDGQQIGWVSSHRAILAALYRCAADPCVPWGWGERVWWLTEGLGYELGLQTLTDLMGKLQLYSLVV